MWENLFHSSCTFLGRGPCAGLVVMDRDHLVLALDFGYDRTDRAHAFRILECGPPGIAHVLVVFLGVAFRLQLMVNLAVEYFGSTPPR